ncbi:MAG: alpha-L-fucosidase [Bacteroidales bacterium]|nr:alpha-L-fucosidase [Bacteroidales bacterium]
MKKILLAAFLPLSLMLAAQERETIWPEGRMPDAQAHQIAAMTDEAGAPGFNPADHRTAYLEWFGAPAESNGGCMILISGGSYQCCCDVNLVKEWGERFTALGFQCVNFVYRTPRPVGLPIYQTAWEDGQRAVRMVRSQAAKRGFDPEKIGTISMSAGSHLALLLATSSQTEAYGRTDEIDDIPCHINWAIVNAPAYVTTDGENGDPAQRQGIGPDVKVSDCFKFDGKTCPMSLHHGGEDPYTPSGSTLVYKELHRRGIPAELHLYPGKGHGAFGLERGIEFINQMQFVKPAGKEVPIMDRYGSDRDRVDFITQEIWPEGEMPNDGLDQVHPCIEWHIPLNRKTDAIQIIWSGGGYYGNSTDGFEVDPVRRYLNGRGMTVVTLRYRTPRPAPETGLAMHTPAWQDVQRAVRVVRHDARSHGCDPNQIGVMGSSAGGHLCLMGVTSSDQRSYLPIDDIDKLPCNVQWGIGIYPAYVLSDGLGEANARHGDGEDLYLAPEFNFDRHTAPMLFLHGDSDVYSSVGSVRVWEKMRSMGIQSELHTLATRNHCFQKTASPGTGSYTWLDRIGEFLDARLDDWWGHYTAPKDGQVLAKLDRWQDLKFGVIFHWGLYSIPGILESWGLCSESESEWEAAPRRERGMSVDEFRKWYWSLDSQMNPTAFNPSEWADIMKDAGMKYMVFTTKHHDGFCMYDSKYTDFKITNTPFGSDPRSNVTKEIFDAFRAKDFMIGAYFSKPDWHCKDYWSPDFVAPGRNHNYDRAVHPDWWRRFTDYTKNQLTEITSDYGNIDILWLDGGWLNGNDVELGEVIESARKRNPGLISVDRACRGEWENYQTPECQIPPAQFDFPWETCDVMAGWGWINNPHYLSKEKIISNLIEVVAKGGNYLLGVGPKPDGTIDGEAARILHGVGDWLRKYGDAIYGTRITADYHQGDVWFTAGKEDKTLNAIWAYKEGSVPQAIEWTGNVPAGKVTLVSTGKALKYRVEGDKVVITLPKNMPAESFALTFKTR